MNAKLHAAKKAIDFIKNGMKVGLGTGSTASLFIQALAEKNLDILCAATSVQSEKLALSLGLKVESPESLFELDITVDGADEVDPENRLIKGLGGALLREKIIACASKELLVIVDPSKLVNKLGKGPLPVEVLPFCHEITQKKLAANGFSSSLRMQKSKPYVTDNGNYIYDVQLPAAIEPERAESSIVSIPGVLETGFFFNIAKKIIIGFDDGRTEIRD